MASRSRLFSKIAKDVGSDGNLTASALGADISLGVTTYDSASQLPLSGLSSGDQAWVGDRLFISNGSGWLNTGLVNLTPSITSGPEGSEYVLDSGGNPVGGSSIEISLTAFDSDGTGVNWSYIASDSANDLAVISNDSNGTFTFTSKSLTDILAAGYDSNGGSFSVTFKASDGIGFDTDSASFTLSYFVSSFPTYTATPSETFITTGTSVGTSHLGGRMAFDGTDILVVSPYSSPVRLIQMTTSGTLRQTTTLSTTASFGDGIDKLVDTFYLDRDTNTAVLGGADTDVFTYKLVFLKKNPSTEIWEIDQTITGPYNDGRAGFFRNKIIGNEAFIADPSKKNTQYTSRAEMGEIAHYKRTDVNSNFTLFDRYEWAGHHTYENYNNGFGGLKFGENFVITSDGLTMVVAYGSDGTQDGYDTLHIWKRASIGSAFVSNQLLTNFSYNNIQEFTGVRGIAVNDTDIIINNGNPNHNWVVFRRSDSNSNYSLHTTVDANTVLSSSADRTLHSLWKFDYYVKDNGNILLAQMTRDKDAVDATIYHYSIVEWDGTNFTELSTILIDPALSDTSPSSSVMEFTMDWETGVLYHANRYDYDGAGAVFKFEWS